MQISRQDVLNLRDSQVNVLASLGVYAAVWAIFQVLLGLFDVDMPLVQLFDRYGNFSFPGILVAGLLLISAFVPHWILLRRANLTWRGASRLIRELREPPPVPPEEHPEWARPAERPMPDTPAVDDPTDSNEYWQRRWEEFIQPHRDDDLGSRD